MWNLRYGAYGKTIKVGTKHQFETTNPVPNTEHTQIFAKKGFKVKHKFKGIKQKNRLFFLQRKAGMHNKKLGSSIHINDLHKMRKGFNQSKITQLPISINTLCYCCCKERATIRHHVVPLAKGGRNKMNNIVPLCNGCHIKIHPHMRKAKRIKKVFVSPFSGGDFTAMSPNNNGPFVIPQAGGAIISTV